MNDYRKNFSLFVDDEKVLIDDEKSLWTVQLSGDGLESMRFGWFWMVFSSFFVYVCVGGVFSTTRRLIVVIAPFSSSLARKKSLTSVVEFRAMGVTAGLSFWRVSSRLSIDG